MAEKKTPRVKAKPKPVEATKDPNYIPITVTVEDLQARHERVLAKHFGCVEDVDRIELRRYCQLIIKIERLRVEMDGNEVVSVKGVDKPNPMLSVIKEYEWQAGMIANRLSLHLGQRQTSLRKHKANSKVDPKDADPKDDDLDFDKELAGSPVPSPL